MDKNLEIVYKFKQKIKNDVDKVIFFGSRAKGNFSQDSDFDILLISKNFEGQPWYKRPIEFYLKWEEDFPLELLCFTPNEIKNNQNRTNIISEALKTGIEV